MGATGPTTRSTFSLAVGNKFLCVVVKIIAEEASAITAYLFLFDHPDLPQGLIGVLSRFSAP